MRRMRLCKYVGVGSLLSNGNGVYVSVSDECMSMGSCLCMANPGDVSNKGKKISCT